MDFNPADFYEISTTISNDAVSRPRIPVPRIEFTRRGGWFPQQMISTIRLNLHNGSHLDLARDLCRDDHDALTDNQKQNYKSLLSLARKPFFVSRCLILSLLKPLGKFTEKIQKSKVSMDNLEGYDLIKPSVSETQYGEILSLLRIDADNLRALMDRGQYEEGQWLILYTGWRQLFPRFRGLEDAAGVLSGLQPYLLPPYLDKECVELLISKKIGGLGYDTVTVNSPLTWLNSNSISSTIRRLAGLIHVEGKPEERSREQHSPQVGEKTKPNITELAKPYYPEEVLVLDNGIPLLEQLSPPRRLFCEIGTRDVNGHNRGGFWEDVTEEEPSPRYLVVKGTMVVFPFVFAGQDEAVPTKVFFKPDAWV